MTSIEHKLPSHEDAPHDLLPEDLLLESLFEFSHVNEHPTSILLRALSDRWKSPQQFLSMADTNHDGMITYEKTNTTLFLMKSFSNTPRQ